VPELLLIEDEHVEDDELAHLAAMAQSRSVHWALATSSPSRASELHALAMGAAEYLPMDSDATLAQARLSRIMRDRFSADRLRRQHSVDTATGLTSRRSFVQHMEREWQRAQGSGTRLSFILMDLDRFKSFNDTHGYIAGNDALSKTARRLQRVIQRPVDRLARFGGNEFAVLLPSTSEADARKLAGQLKASVTDAQIEHGGTLKTPYLGISTGVSSLVVGDDDTIHRLHDLALEDLRRSRADLVTGPIYSP